MRPALFLTLFVACGSDGGQPLDAAVDSVVVDTPPDAIDAINGCTPAMAVDLTAAAANRTIQFDDDFYLPRCARIRAGQSVTWTGDFQDHPLAPGILRSGMVLTQVGSPITMTTTGSSASVTFPDAGAWAYYCPNHPPGMSGVIYVDP